MLPEPVHVLLVDDEPLVRAGVRAQLAAMPDVVVVGEAGDGPAAVAAIESLRPQLVCLDVQLPGFDGFEVLAALPPDERPAVVFVTAHEQYALRAFEANAVDYLLKPFDGRRFAAAFAKARRWLEVGERPRLDPLLAAARAGRPAERFVVRQGGRVQVIEAPAVEWFEARGNYVLLHHAGGEFLMRETMAALQERLDPARFVRVHRSAIVAVGSVVEVRRGRGGEGGVRLRGGVELPLGRTCRAEVLAALQRARG